MATRLEILERSLEKKDSDLARKLQNHFDDVASANGQPLNDKRNGHATMARWDKQSDSIRNQIKEIEKTKSAIEREKNKVSLVKYENEEMPEYIREMIAAGTLIQWRKHPHIMFVDGVDGARIVKKEGVFYHRYISKIKDKDQWKKFAVVFNKINSIQKENIGEK